jgi:hypothetical protein
MVHMVCLVVTKVWERPLIRKHATQKCDTEKFSLKPWFDEGCSKLLDRRK